MRLICSPMQTMDQANEAYRDIRMSGTMSGNERPTRIIEVKYESVQNTSHCDGNKDL
jgi:hypothetical protein